MSKFFAIGSVVWLSLIVIGMTVGIIDLGLRALVTAGPVVGDSEYYIDAVSTALAKTLVLAIAGMPGLIAGILTTIFCSYRPRWLFKTSLALAILYLPFFPYVTAASIA